MDRCARSAQLLLLAVSLLLATLEPASALPGSGEDSLDSIHGTIHGRVLVGDRPGAYANVVVLGTQRGALCDSLGRFTVSLLPVGIHSLRAILIGCETGTVSVAVRAGTDVQVPDIILAARRRWRWRPHAPSCDSTRSLSDNDSSAIAALGRVDTTGWQWVGGSVFDFRLPPSFHRPSKAGRGIDSEVGSWEDSARRVSYDLGDYTGHTESGQDFFVEMMCIDGVVARVAIYRTSDPASYHVETYFAEIGLGLFGECARESDGAVLLTAFRSIRFHNAAEALRRPVEPRK